MSDARSVEFPGLATKSMRSAFTWLAVWSPGRTGLLFAGWTFLCSSLLSYKTSPPLARGPGQLVIRRPAMIMGDQHRTLLQGHARGRSVVPACRSPQSLQDPMANSAERQQSVSFRDRNLSLSQSLDSKPASTARFAHGSYV